MYSETWLFTFTSALSVVISFVQMGCLFAVNKFQILKINLYKLLASLVLLRRDIGESFSNCMSVCFKQVADIEASCLSY